MVIEDLKAQRINPGTNSESKEAMFIAQETAKPYKLPVRKPQWYNDPKIKKKIKVGSHIFAREVRPEALN